MPRDKTENHEKIIAAAMKEFMEYGFNDASMRRIAAACDMSVAGLYKHFPSKEDMFAALVEPIYNDFLSLYENAEYEQFNMMTTMELSEIWNDGKDSQLIIDFVYDNFDAFKLLICKSQGTKYENFVHDVAVMEEKTTRRFLDIYKKRGGHVNKIVSKELHLLVTVNTNAVFETVEHGFTKKEAMHYAKTLDEFFTASWRKYFGFDD